MSHPPERLLVELAQVLLKVDAEAVVHLEFCDACTVRFSLAFAELLCEGEPSLPGGAAGAVPQRRRRSKGRAVTRARPSHPSDGSVAGCALTLLAMNEKVFDHARRCPPCLWKVIQDVAAAAPQREPRAGKAGAAGLLADLEGLSPAERETRVLSIALSQRFSVARRLGREAGRLLASDPRRAEELARLALLAGDASAPGGGGADFLACTWAKLGEARRRQVDLAGAEQALDMAAAYEAGTEAAGERWFFLAELRRDQGRSAEAIVLYERAEGCFASCGAVERQAVAGMRAAALHFAEWRLEEAALKFERICPLAGHGLSALGVIRAALGQVCALASAGRGEEAVQAEKIYLLCLAEVVRSPFAPRDQAWLEAVVDGQVAPDCLPAVLAKRLAEGGSREAALVGLDLAAALAKKGATAELVRLATEVRPLTLPGVLPPPGRRLVERVIAAVEEGSVTVDQIRRAADTMALYWTEPELAFGA